jgi:hypothetical protein
MKRKVKNKLQKWTVFPCVQRDVPSINQTKFDKWWPRAGLSEGQTFLGIRSINHGPTKPHFSVGRGGEVARRSSELVSFHIPRNGTSQDIWLNRQIQMWVKDFSHTCYRSYLSMNFTVVHRWRKKHSFLPSSGCRIEEICSSKNTDTNLQEILGFRTLSIVRIFPK